MTFDNQSTAAQPENLSNSGDDESVASFEDEDAELITPTVHLKVIHALDRIRRKDPFIYSKESKLFGDGDIDLEALPVPDTINEAKETTQTETRCKQAILTVKPTPQMRLTEVVRSHKRSAQQDPDTTKRRKAKRQEAEITISQEKDEGSSTKEIVEATISDPRLEFMREIDNDQGGDDELFSIREKSENEMLVEDLSYRDFISSAKSVCEGNSDEVKHLKRFLDPSEDVSLTDHDKFLRDYIINQRCSYTL
eukprot:GHVN01077416.1.p1 GENE.GHVN01077416.1~~GHVN01077416.1.p1  ORF type:complete len:252 (+),score=48.62 GHVN01077416.1:312-1067(+)